MMNSIKRKQVIDEAIQIHKELENIGLFTPHDHESGEPCTCKEDIFNYFGIDTQEKQIAFMMLKRLNHLNSVLIHEDQTNQFISNLPHN